MAREIESMQLVYMIPLVQRRNLSWEFFFRRSNYWACHLQEDGENPVFDADELAELPDRYEPIPCH
jgi:hypothetical protein